MGRWFTEISRVVRFAFGFKRKQDELDTEMRFHVEEATDDLVEQGMDREEARKMALRDFGEFEKIKEDCRDSWGVGVVENLMRDLSISFRGLKRSKGFALTCVLTLGLCIGVNAAIFSLVNAAFLKPLPFKEPDRLVEVYNTFSDSEPLQKYKSNFTLWEDYTLNTSAFESTSLYRDITYTFYNDDAPLKIEGSWVTTEFFETLGVMPFLGRFFEKSDAYEGNDTKIILSYELWRHLYGEDPDVVGTVIEASGRQLEIIGVSPVGIDVFSEECRFYRTSFASEEVKRNTHRFNNNKRFIGRLTKNVTVEQATLQMRSRDKLHYDSQSESKRARIDGWRHLTMVTPLEDVLVENARATIYLLQGGALLVLLIGCLNLTNLVAARSNMRQYEFGVRRSLGSGRFAIVKQLLVECCLFSLSGGILAMVISWILVSAFNRLGSGLLLLPNPVSLDWVIVSSMFAVSVFAGLFLGFVSAIKLAGMDTSMESSSGTRTASSGRALTVASSIMVASQVGVSLLLLIGAGLLFRSYYNANARELGFNSRNVMAFRILIPAEGYTVSGTLAPFQGLVVDSIKSIPGVEAVSLSAKIPMREKDWQGAFAVAVQNFEQADRGDANYARYNQVSPGFFETMGIRMLRGEDFERLFGDEKERFLVVNKSLAERFFPNEDPIGKRMACRELAPEDADDWLTIIGVVEDTVLTTTKEASIPFQLYRNVMSHGYAHEHKDITILVKSSRRHDSLVLDVRDVIKNLDGRIPIVESGDLDSFKHASMKQERVVLWLVLAYSGLALSLSAIGIFGVLSHDIAVRRREIGIRSALGANYWMIVRLFFARGMTMASIGLGVGIVVALALSGQIARFLFEVDPVDVTTYSLTAIFLLGIASVASFLPVVQHLKRNPIESLSD